MYEPGFWMFLGSLYASLQVGKHLNRRWIHPFVQDRPDATSQRSQKRSEDLPKVCYYSQSLFVTSKQGLICFWAEDTLHSSGLSGDMGMNVVNVYLMLSWDLLGILNQVIAIFAFPCIATRKIYIYIYYNRLQKWQQLHAWDMHTYLHLNRVVYLNLRSQQALLQYDLSFMVKWS